ncbi:MAG: HD domain-containing protein [Candidatus Hodarchaeota archaeon]
MLEKERLSLVRKYSIEHSEEDDIHGFLHVERVLKICLQLGKKLNANLLILEISALLHDIGRKLKKNSSSTENHAELSAELALKFLKSYDFKLSQEDFDNIIHCIRSHSFSNNSNPITIEAKILSDADKLDALGAIGLYRTIGFTIKNQGGIEEVIKHLENKILKLKDQMNLEISKQIAVKNHQVVLDFYNKLKEERL